MKEITRRLYTKPVMIGMAFLVGMVLLAGLFVTTRSKAAMTTYIPAGDDRFETTNNGETYHNFAASPVPAGFFGSGSQAYSGLVPLEGVPLPGQGDTDTIIHRNQPVYTPGTTTLTMTGLSLKSINSITVTYDNGNQEAWSLRVNLSDLKASTGSMSFSDSGTFDSSLSVFPKFTFTRLSDGAVKVLDTGSSGSTAPMSQAVMSDSVDGESDAVPTATIAPCSVTAINDSDSLSRFSATAAASTGSCAPVTLTSTNNPWPITRPITEQELLASHHASPPGTKKALATKTAAIGE